MGTAVVGHGTADVEAEPGQQAGCRLHASNLRLAYGENVVVNNLDLNILEGSITSLIGPNGCGKSTILRALGRLLRPVSGAVFLDGKQIDRTPTREVAQTVGVLPQSPNAPEGLTVADLVARGRHPHQRWYRQWSQDDSTAVSEALAWTNMTELAGREIDELSGGQRQRAWIAMTLAQGTDVLLLDEPTTYLDLAHQVDVLDLISRLHSEWGRTVVMVLHDLNLASRYSERMFAVCEGGVVSQGSPGEVVTEDVLRKVFGLEAKVVPDPVSDGPMVVPIRHST